MKYADMIEQFASQPRSVPRLSPPLLASLIGQKLAERNDTSPIEWVDSVANTAQWKKIETLIAEHIMSDGGIHPLLQLGDLLRELAYDLYVETVEQEFVAARRKFECESAREAKIELEIDEELERERLDGAA